MIDKAEAGPQFGAEGLIIPLQQGQEQLAKSRLGTYYARRENGSRSLFADGEEKRAHLTDLKVGHSCLLLGTLSWSEPFCSSLHLVLNRLHDKAAEAQEGCSLDDIGILLTAFLLHADAAFRAAFCSSAALHGD